MAEENFSKQRISNFQGLVTLTLDQVILHHSSTSTYMPNFIEIKENFADRRTNVGMDGWIFETHFIRSTQKSGPNEVFLH